MGSINEALRQIELSKDAFSNIGALRAAALEWEFERINFVVGNRGSVVESDFYTKLEKLHVHTLRREKK